MYIKYWVNVSGMPKRGRGAQVPTSAGHLGEMSHSPAPYTSNQTPFGGIKKPAPPHFQCAVHAADKCSLLAV